MKLTVKNFGPIREARNININSMTIFVGPSNTGKSYLAMLIYSIFKVIADEDYAWEITSRIRGGRKNYLDISNNLNKSKSSALAVIEASFYEWAKAISDAWKHQLIYCFGEEGRNLIEAKNGNDGFSVIISDNDDQLTLNLTSPANSNTTLRKRKQLHEYIKLRFSDNIEEHMVQETSWESDESELSRSVIHRQYPEIILQQFLSSLLPWKPRETFIDAHYLPAIRGGIMQSHRTLISTVIERAPMAGLSRAPTIPPFNGVCSDFMTKLINIGSGEFERMGLTGSVELKRWRHKQAVVFPDKQAKIEEIGRNIEQGILSGEIDIQTSEVSYPDFRYKFKKGGKDYNLPLMSASSLITELAPVSLFIRHYVCLGDLFIVEEPEAHLHPAAQRDFSDVLVRLVDADVRVLVTTHSDNILEQVSNFIYAADIPHSKLTKLDEEKCSVYLFKPGRGGNKTTVKKIPFDSETGLLTQDHLDVSSELYNQTVNLMEQRDNAGSQTDIS